MDKIFWILVILIPLFIYFRYLFKADADHKRKTSTFEPTVRDALTRRQFQVDKRFKTSYGLLYFDMRNRRGAYLAYVDLVKIYLTPLTTLQFFPLDKITSCALVQDGTMVHQNAVVPGMVGAALFGLGGALAGATAMNSSENCGHLSVRVLIDDAAISSVTVPTLNCSLRKSDEGYTAAFSLAQQIYNEFEGIVHYNRARQSTASQPVAPAAPAPRSEPAEGSLQANAQLLDQIKRIAQLHAEGILTDEEFTSKKKALLDKMY